MCLYISLNQCCAAAPVQEAHVRQCRSSPGGGRAAWRWRAQHDGNNSALHNLSQTLFAQRGRLLAQSKCQGHMLGKDGDWAGREWSLGERVDQQRLWGGHWGESEDKNGILSASTDKGSMFTWGWLHMLSAVVFLFFLMQILFWVISEKCSELSEFKRAAAQVLRGHIQSTIYISQKKTFFYSLMHTGCINILTWW